jgi:hypothetical protein
MGIVLQLQPAPAGDHKLPDATAHTNIHYSYLFLLGLHKIGGANSTPKSATPHLYGVFRPTASSAARSRGAIGSLSENFGALGYVIVGVFVAAWAISYVVYGVNRYDEIEVSAG